MVGLIPGQNLRGLSENSLTTSGEVSSSSEVNKVSPFFSDGTSILLNSSFQKTICPRPLIAHCGHCDKDLVNDLLMKWIHARFQEIYYNGLAGGRALSHLSLPGIPVACDEGWSVGSCPES